MTEAGGYFCEIDMNNHAELSFFLSKGFETKFGHLKLLNYQNVPSVTPYHYSEIWINIFITKILHNINIGYNLSVGCFMTKKVYYTNAIKSDAASKDADDIKMDKRNAVMV